MADTPSANLGYGKQSETTIDNANQAMRQMPFYQNYMRAHGQDPGHPTLTKSQSQELLKLAQGAGFVVDEGNMEMDDHGNFNPKGHKLRNTLIIAGIAAATVATMGAAGAFAGPAVGGGTAATGAGAGTAAGLAGVEGAAAGLPASAIAALGTGAMGAVPVTAGAGLAALGGGAEAFDAAGNFIGPSSVTGEVGGGGGLLSTGSKLASLGSKLGSLADTATTIAGNGQDPALNGIGAANAAAQAARNRILGAQVDQGGPSADATALKNVRNAGLVSNFKDVAPNAYGSPGITIGDPARQFAAQFQQQLLDRQKAGKSATTFGVPDPTPQELADEAKARAIAQGGSGIPGATGKVLDTIKTGARLAQLAPGVIKTGRDIWSMF